MRPGFNGCLAALVAGTFLSAAGVADAIVYRPGYGDYHLNLAQDNPYYESVGQVSLYNARGGYIAHGSGVLISKRWVLTAAHVVESASDAPTDVVSSIVFERGNYDTATPGYVNPYNPIGGGYTEYSGRTHHFASNAYVPKQYNGDILHGFDIALIDLGPGAITGRAAVAKLPPAGRRIGYGKKQTIVGYGSRGEVFIDPNRDINLGRQEVNHRRAGNNINDGKLMNIVSMYPNPNEDEGQPLYLPVANHITAYDFDAGGVGDAFFDDGVFDLNDFPILGEVTAAFGDSGGGVFHGNTLTGLVSGGFSRIEGVPTYQTLGFNTEVSVFTNWIRRVIEAVQTNDRTQPWLYRQVNALNPLIFEDLEQAQNVLRFGDGVVVPEPTTALLLLAAGGLFAGRRRR